MRTLGARLMDHFRLNEVFGMRSTLELFEGASHRAHYTSALRYPVLKAGKNYSGHDGLLRIPFLRGMVDDHLAGDVALGHEVVPSGVAG